MIFQPLKMDTGVVPATTPPMPKSVKISLDKISKITGNKKELWGFSFFCLYLFLSDVGGFICLLLASSRWAVMEVFNTLLVMPDSL